VFLKAVADLPRTEKSDHARRMDLYRIAAVFRNATITPLRQHGQYRSHPQSSHRGSANLPFNFG
jgi:hypothetical protein